MGEHVAPLAPGLLFKASLKALLFVTIRASRSAGRARSGRYAVRPPLRARGFSRGAGLRQRAAKGWTSATTT